MEIRIKDVTCQFTFGFFAILAVYMLLDPYGMGLAMLGAVLLHECGHLIVLYHCGGRLERVVFAPYGIRMEKRGFLSYNGEIAVYSAGVCANALTVMVCALIGIKGVFLWLNLFLAIFHLLPIGRLDGGMLLYLILSRLGMGRLAPMFSACVSLSLLCPLFCMGVWMGLAGNWTLFFTAAYLFSIGFLSNRRMD